jgi:hypothetical protein
VAGVPSEAGAILTWRARRSGDSLAVVRILPDTFRWLCAGAAQPVEGPILGGQPFALLYLSYEFVYLHDGAPPRLLPSQDSAGALPLYDV